MCKNHQTWFTKQTKSALVETHFLFNFAHSEIEKAYIALTLSISYILSLGFPQKNAERRRQQSIEETKRECERQAAAEAAKVAEIHRNKCDELNER